MTKDEGEEVSEEKPLQHDPESRLNSPVWAAVWVGLIVMGCVAYMVFQWLWALSRWEPPNAGD